MFRVIPICLLLIQAPAYASNSQALAPRSPWFSGFWNHFETGPRFRAAALSVLLMPAAFAITPGEQNTVEEIEQYLARSGYSDVIVRLDEAAVFNKFANRIDMRTSAGSPPVLIVNPHWLKMKKMRGEFEYKVAHEKDHVSHISETERRFNLITKIMERDAPNASLVPKLHATRDLVLELLLSLDEIHAADNGSSEMRESVPKPDGKLLDQIVEFRYFQGRRRELALEEMSEPARRLFLRLEKMSVSELESLSAPRILTRQLSESS